MAVGDMDQIFHHLFAADTAAELGRAPQGSVESVHHIHLLRIVRSGGPGGALKLSANEPHQGAFGVDQPGDGVIAVECLLPLGIGNGMSEKRFKFPVRHVGDAAAFVTGQAAVGSGRAGTADMHGGGQADVCGAGGCIDIIISVLDLPAACFDVPVAPGLVVQGDGDPAGFARFQEYLGEAFQLLFRAENPAVPAGNIYLGDLRAVGCAGIGQGKADGVLIRFHAGVGESCVAQAMAERIADRRPCGIIVAVANIQALPVFGGCLSAGIIPVTGGVLQSQGPGLRQLAAGRGPACQDVSHSPRAGLTGQVTVDGGAVNRRVGHDKGRAAAENQNDVGIDPGNGPQQGELVLRQAHVSAVQALHFGAVIQPQAQQHHFGAERQTDGFIDQVQSIPAVGAAKALGIAA